jgi:hypothetical protein
MEPSVDIFLLPPVSHARPGPASIGMKPALLSQPAHRVIPLDDAAAVLFDAEMLQNAVKRFYFP